MEVPNGTTCFSTCLSLLHLQSKLCDTTTTSNTKIAFCATEIFPEIAFFLHPNSVGHRFDCGFLVVESLANTFMCRHKFLLRSAIWQCWMCCFNLPKPPLRLGAGLEDLRKNFSKNLQELSANPLVRRLARPPNRVFSVLPASILATIVLK